MQIVESILLKEGTPLKRVFYFVLALTLLIIPNLANTAVASDSLSFASKNDKNFSVNVLGPTYYASLAYSKYITSNIENEFGLGFIGAFIGCKYHWWIGPNIDREYLSPYFGLYYSRSLLSPFFNSTTSLLSFRLANSIYVPLGLQFYGREHFNIALEIAAVKVFEDYTNNRYGLFPYFGIKVGYYF
jgi:hypothetical protein